MKQTVTIEIANSAVLPLLRNLAALSLIKFTSETAQDDDPVTAELNEINDIRLLLQKEMAEKGTLAVEATAGDGWEAHVKEHYAEP